METETIQNDVEVEITIDFSEIQALIEDGELLAHPTNAPMFAIIYDQHDRAPMLVSEYQDTEDALQLVLSEQDLAEVIEGNNAEWDGWYPEGYEVTLAAELNPIDLAGPQLTHGDIS